MASEEENKPQAPPAQVSSEAVLQILQSRSARDKELALHLEAATLQAAVQQQQMTIQQMLADTESKAPAKAPAKKKAPRKPAAKK